jgi:hypothetical protein
MNTSQSGLTGLGPQEVFNRKRRKRWEAIARNLGSNLDLMAQQMAVDYTQVGSHSGF